MANNNKTVFQRLTDVIIGTGNVSPSRKSVNYSFPASNQPLYSFDNKEDRDKKLLQLKQQKLLSHQWAKASYDTSMTQMQGANQIKMMYFDVDRMDTWPEIGAALDIYSEEACTQNKKGQILNIHSKSPRIKAILEDLFINRLDIHISSETVARGLAKYGNQFYLLNLDAKNGVTGWKELPVHEMTRVENGMLNAYGAGTGAFSADATNLKDGEVKFIWDGHNNNIPFKNWQIAHFRLVKDSLFLPYGNSILHKARRHWRILSMMEDAMLLYRLERSIERRIFKVNVGLIDDLDVPAFLQDFMNNVKRAPIIDPMTGMIDLRKNFLDVSADYVIPVRNGQDPTSIETLQSANNPTSMDDIEYVENKILSALRMPKSFLNFQEPQGKGQNLSIMDIRFNRAINSLQKALLMEFTRIAIIHLYLLGFTDDLTNFSITMNNPSNQIEQMELDNQAKRLQNATSALAEQGGGIPLMSWHRVQKEIMGLTDAEISDMLNEIRLETAISMELQLTNQIIKKTGVFRKTDNIYGEPGAEYDYSALEGGAQGGLGGGGIGSAIGGGGFGDDLGDLGEPGAETEGDIGGDEGTQGLEDMGGGGQPLMESVMRHRQYLKENKRLHNYFAEYQNLILKKNNPLNERVGLLDKAFLINEEMDSTIKALEQNKIDELVD